MKRSRISGFAFYVLGLGLTGCASEQARYVYQDRDSGVIAIPRNTPKLMAQAEALMEKHFPGKNYEVVRTVEVETGGSRATYESDSTNVEAAARRNRILRESKISHDRDRQEAESTKLVESRIVYRKRLPAGRTGLAFAEAPEFTPKGYSDDVTEHLLGAARQTTELAKANTPKTTKDKAVIPAAGVIKVLSPPSLGDKGN
jgi:hypothetical protein